MTRLNYTLSDALPSLPKSGMPVTIITGFLGSGKTTLLNQILQNKDDLKVAVLVNEFGDINIDEQLLISVESDMVELDNGCICCTINDSLVDAVYRVLEREEKVDYLVIETTGLADPLPIILTFLSTELKFLTRVDAVITVVDAAAFDAKHFDSEAALSQIRYGDMVILNKIDLATGAKITELKAFIEDIKPGFRILESEYSKVPLPLILDIGLTQPEGYQAEISEFRRDKSAFNNHLANDGFDFVSFQSDRPFELEKFTYFLTEQLRCLSACNRPCTVAFAAPNKTTLMFGDLPPMTSPSSILRFAEQYFASHDGLIKRQDRPEILQKGILARIPPLPPLNVVT